MAIVLPPSVPVDGMLKVTWVPTLLAPLAPKMTELSAVSSIDITCYLTKDGSLKSKFDQATYEDGRACTADTWEQLGAIKRSLNDIQYVYQPQAPAADVTNAAYEKLVPGTKGYFVVRRGMAYETASAVGQFVSVIGVTLGGRDDVSETTNSVSKIGQKLAPYFYVDKVALVV